MSFSKDLPNTTQLRQRISETWGDFTEKTNAELGELARLHRKWRIIGSLSGAFLVFFPFTITLLDLFEALPKSWIAYYEPGVFTISIFFVAGSILVALPLAGLLKARHVSTVFSHKLNQAVFPKAFDVLDIEATHMNEQMFGGKLATSWIVSLFSVKGLPQTLRPDGTYKKQILDLLDHSELVTESRNTVTVDDSFSSTILERDAFFAELDLKHVTGSGKNRRVKNIFKGIFVSYDLPVTLSHKTFISTEGDESNFGHISFWNDIRGKGAQETVLEWNDFENKLHVAATNPTEARYILTPDFMQDLYDWWKEKHQNIRIAFIANRMYILFPDRDVRFQQAVSKLETQTLQNYVFNIAEPVMHVLHLIEDVRVRFR